MIFKAYKYRIYPNEEQKALLKVIFDQTRFIYNISLEVKQMAYSSTGTKISYFDLTSQIKELKDTICPWLKESPAQALNHAAKNLDNAYNLFFKGKKYPKFKNTNEKQSFQLPQGTFITKNNKQIFFRKLRYVDIDMHRPYDGIIKTATISMDPTGEYYVSLQVQINESLPDKKPITEKTSIGIDLGIKHFAVTSEGKKFENQDFLKSELNQLNIERKSLARKKKGSNNYKKQRIVVAKIHAKIKNRRNDYLHKISKWLVENYDTICIENLGITDMMKNHNLARAIADMGWYKFRLMLEYKAKWYGKNIQIIGRFEPSTKTCSNCGHVNKKIGLGDREWDCSNCGTTHDRDINAAINIKDMGLKKTKRVKV